MINRRKSGSIGNSLNNSSIFCQTSTSTVESKKFKGKINEYEIPASKTTNYSKTYKYNNDYCVIERNFKKNLTGKRFSLEEKRENNFLENENIEIVDGPEDAHFKFVKLINQNKLFYLALGQRLGVNEEEIEKEMI